MAYIDVLPLADAKLHLRVDDTADDTAITRMIKSAFRYIESQTNVLVYQRNVTYLMVDGQALIYDYPVDSVVDPTDYDSDCTVRKHGYSVYNYGSETIDLTLNVGYLEPSEVPQDLVDVALEIIDLMYYQHETGKDWKKDLSAMSKDILDSHRRFIL